MNRKNVRLILIIFLLLTLAFCIYIIYNSYYSDWANEIMIIALPILIILVVFIGGSFLFTKYRERVVYTSKNYKVDERNVEKNIFSSMNLKTENDDRSKIEESISVSSEKIKCHVCGHLNKKNSIICEKCSNYLK